MSKKPLVISVTGNIGAGKTYLIEALYKEFTAMNIPVIKLLEPTDSWIKPYNYIREIEQNTPLKAIAQAYILETMAKQLRDAKDFNGVILLERGVHNAIHEFAFTENRPLVRHLYHTIAEEERNIGVSCIISLETPIELCCERISSRNRIGEFSNGIDGEYLTLLALRHQDFINLAKYFIPDRVITMKADYNIKEEVERLLEKLEIQ